MLGYIVSIAINSMIVLKAFTVSTSFMMVWPVSRSIAPWMFRRSVAALFTATGTSFGASSRRAEPRGLDARHQRRPRFIGG